MPYLDYAVQYLDYAVFELVVLCSSHWILTTPQADGTHGTHHDGIGDDDGDTGTSEPEATVALEAPRLALQSNSSNSTTQCRDGDGGWATAVYGRTARQQYYIIVWAATSV